MMGQFQVWDLSSGKLLSCANNVAGQEAEMDYWIEQLPDALLVYRFRRSDGSYDDETPLDRSLNEVCRNSETRAHMMRAHPWR